MNAPRLKSGTPNKLRIRQIIAGLTLGGLMALGTGAAKAAVVFADNFNSEVAPVAPPGAATGPFGTQYGFVPSSGFGLTPGPAVPGTTSGALVPEGLMAFVPNSAVVHGLWADFAGDSNLKTTYTPEADHSGLFLAVNGLTDAPGQIVYQRAGIVVAPNSTNDFQADLVSLFGGAVANLEFRIEFYAADNTSVGGSFAVGNSPTIVAQWGTVVLPSIVAPSNTATATITLRNSVTEANGNDFGVDNIILSSTPQNPPPPPPPPSTNCVVVAGCETTVNPAGRNKPNSGATDGASPRSGQNPDGFYILQAGWTCPNGGALQVFVKDSASAFFAGPFAPGDKVKITQAPGVTPNWKKMAGVVVAHIQLKGDALVYACYTDPVTLTMTCSDPHSCLVPPKPK